MNIKELTKDQLSQVKQSYLCERNESVSYNDLVNADELVSDETIFNEYANTVFTEDDFF